MKTNTSNQALSGRPSIRAFAMASALVAATLLGACGGGGDSPAVAELREVPAAAMASSKAFSDWMGTVGADDSAEGLEMGVLEVPTSETEEPVDVN